MSTKPDRHSPATCPLAADCGVIVPQKVFAVHGPAPFIGKYPVRFFSNGRPGIRLADVLDSSVDIDGANSVPDLSETAKKINLRINWPGYEPWHQVVHIFAYTYNADPITVGKLAQEIAKAFMALIWDYSSYPCSEPGWTLGSFMSESLTLVELRHVSMGSWQPVFASLYEGRTTALDKEHAGHLKRRARPQPRVYTPLPHESDGSPQASESVGTHTTVPIDRDTLIKYCSSPSQGTTFPPFKTEAPQSVRFRWFDILVALSTTTGIWKFVATHLGQSFIPNLLDLIVGTFGALTFSMLSLFSDSPRLKFLFQNSPRDDMKRLFLWTSGESRHDPRSTAELSASVMELGVVPIISLPPTARLASHPYIPQDTPVE